MGVDMEALALAAGADKARDDHGYVSLYSMLFEPIRHRVRNITEIGIHHGKSLTLWHGYFARANIYGIDISVQPQARERCVQKQIA